MNVFVDTSAFYALLSRDDQHHEEAAVIWEQLLGDPAAHLYTSNYIIVESCALMANRLGKSAVTRFINQVLPAVTVVWIDDVIHQAATEALLAGSTRGPSLVDYASFAMMHAQKMANAFAYDAHFARHGFTIVSE